MKIYFVLTTSGTAATVLVIGVVTEKFSEAMPSTDLTSYSMWESVCFVLPLFLFLTKTLNTTIISFSEGASLCKPSSVDSVR